MQHSAMTALVLFECTLVSAGICHLVVNHSQAFNPIVLDDIQMLKQCIEDERPDILIIDYRLLPENKIPYLRSLVQKVEYLPVLIVCEQYPVSLMSDLQLAGMSSCLLLTASFEEFNKSISELLLGRSYFPQDLMLLLMRRKEQCDDPKIKKVLSRRELEVFHLVARGLPTHTIADEMALSPKTVNTYRYRVFEKLGVENNVKLTHLAIRQGLIDLTERTDNY